VPALHELNDEPEFKMNIIYYCSIVGDLVS